MSCSRSQPVELDRSRSPLIRRRRSTSSNGSLTPTPKRFPRGDSMWFEAESDGIASPHIEPYNHPLSLVQSNDDDNGVFLTRRAMEVETPSEMVMFDQTKRQVDLTGTTFQKEATHKDSHKQIAVIGVVGAVVGMVVAPFAAPAVLGMVGFTSTGGVVAGSLAASIQAGMGGTIAAGSSFAVAQSVASGGALPFFGNLISGAILAIASAFSKWLYRGK